MLFGEHAGAAMAEEQPAQNVSRNALHRQREIAADRQVSRWHAEVRCALPVAWIELTSSSRTGPSPRKVGASSAVSRGWGKFANASRGAPDSVYSM